MKSRNHVKNMRKTPESNGNKPGIPVKLRKITGSVTMSRYQKLERKSEFATQSLSIHLYLAYTTVSFIYAYQSKKRLQSYWDTSNIKTHIKKPSKPPQTHLANANTTKTPLTPTQQHTSPPSEKHNGELSEYQEDKKQESELIHNAY